MTEQRNDTDDRRLEALYREAGDVEPEAGLDRIVRARAAEAAHSDRSPSRIPWLGGLVTASVAIIAIAVVLQQAPPDRPPESPAPQVPLESGDFGSESLMAPSVGADSTLESSAETRRARSQMREGPSAGAGELEAAPPPSGTALGAQSLSEQQRAERLGDIVAEQASNVAEPMAPKFHEIVEDPEAMLAHMEALLESGEIQRARALLQALKREYPDHVVPEAIETALRKESAGDPQ